MEGGVGINHRSLGQTLVLFGVLVFLVKMKSPGDGVT